MSNLFKFKLSIIRPNWTCNKISSLTKTLQFKTKRSRTNFTIIVYILSKIYNNLMSGKSCTTR